MTNIPDRVTIVRRTADGTEYAQAVGPCSFTPGAVYVGESGTPPESTQWREVGTLAGIRVVSDPAMPEGEMVVVSPDGSRTRITGIDTPAESDILATIDQLERDEIDDLVDLQMRQERSGYDHSINQKPCIHCGEDAHSVPITERMQQMRRLFRSTISYYEGERRASDEVVAQLDAYRYDQDDSPIICPGSEFIGAPKPPAWKLEQARRATERQRTITASSAAANSMMDLWSFTLPEEVQFPRSFVTWSTPRPSVSEWGQHVLGLHRELQIHLYRNLTVVLMPDERAPGHSNRLEAVWGIPVRYALISEGYVGYLHPASESGIGAAMCDYLALERAGTEPVIVVSRQLMESAVRTERYFVEPSRVDFRDTVSTTIPVSPLRSFAELRGMRITELDSLDYIVIGYRMEVPSAEDIARQFRPDRPDIVFQRDASIAGDDDESFSDPPPANRRQRRGYRESADPMRTRRPGRRGR